MTGVTPPWPTGPFDLILADPPWQFVSWGPRGNMRGASRYYDTSTTDGICTLPVESLAAPNAVLLVWAVWNRIHDALRVIDAWGFTYKTDAWVWVKTNRDGSPFMGMGYWTRGNTEPCLLATRGKPLHRFDRGISDVLFAPRREHSRKPDEQYERIDRLFGPDVRKLELFARQAWPGYTAWGNQVNQYAPQQALPLESPRQTPRMKQMGFSF